VLDDCGLACGLLRVTTIHSVALLNSTSKRSPTAFSWHPSLLVLGRRRNSAQTLVPSLNQAKNFQLLGKLPRFRVSRLIAISWLNRGFAPGDQGPRLYPVGLAIWPVTSLDAGALRLLDLSGNDESQTTPGIELVFSRKFGRALGNPQPSG
jgi:hypothetical protein